MSKLYYPATQENREAIWSVLGPRLRGDVLEVASGSGEHGVYFAGLLQEGSWTCSDPDPANRASIAEWTGKTALDIDAQRLEMVRANLGRTARQARLVAADLTAAPDWWDGRPFDRILLTAAAEDPPKPLLDQLRVGGIMVLPVGQSNAVQTLIRVEKTESRSKYCGGKLESSVTDDTYSAGYVVELIDGAWYVTERE